MYPVRPKQYTYISLGFKERYDSENEKEVRRLKEMGIYGLEHKGVDITGKWGYKSRRFEVISAVPGQVIYVGESRGRGKVIKVQSSASDKGCVHLYCH